jgi:homoserine O-acetyltransferase
LDSPEAVIENYHRLVSSWDANDLIALASTWQNNNVGDTKEFNGDPEQALRSIKARVLYMPSETDMYFHIDALRQEAQFIPGVQFTVIPTLWGHVAGTGSSPNDNIFINQEISEFLN